MMRVRLPQDEQGRFGACGSSGFFPPTHGASTGTAGYKRNLRLQNRD
jgi:hypothetical protein